MYLPQEILDKLNKDQGKYNKNINNREENKKIINEDNKATKENDKNKMK